jgi:phage replication-related protein YjqB (UPF0714/DUF867 family)
MSRRTFCAATAVLALFVIGAAYAQTKPEVDARPKYSSFAEMAKAERADTDFKVVYRSGSRAFLVTAPHGGAIEPGSSEIADAIAGDTLGYYSFSGLKKDSSGLLIPSTRFDEPEMKGLSKKYNSIVAIHVIEGKDRTVFVSGNNRPIAQAITANLVKLGYLAKAPGQTETTAFGMTNFVNKGGSGGVQIEISSALLDEMFRGPAANARIREDPSRRTPEFARFVQAVRVVLQQAGGNVGGIVTKPKADEPKLTPPSTTQPTMPPAGQWGGRRGGRGGGGRRGGGGQ